jgi:hypothetical protein
MRTWESKESPETLFRLQGYLNLTRNVEEITRTDENGTEETFYKYEVIRLKDRIMPTDIDAFLIENYDEIRKAVIMEHWPQSAQNEAVCENARGDSTKLDELNAFILAVRAEYPKA